MRLSRVLLLTFHSSGKNVQVRTHAERTAFVVGLSIAALVLLSGCTVMQPHRLKPFIAPPIPDGSTTCQRRQIELYALPGTKTETTNDFEKYFDAAQQRLRTKLPPSIQQHKVTSAFLELFATAVGEAQLDAQIANGNFRKNDPQVAAQRDAIQRHSVPKKLSHKQLKDFADKIFDLMKPGEAALTASTVDRDALSAEGKKLLDTHPDPDKAFIEYFKAYYHGKFVDRLGKSITKPQISLTIPNSEIAAAETVLLEYFIDVMDATPVMGDTDPAGASTHYYPGNSKPTALSAGLAVYKPIATDPDECGITTTNAWILGALANGAGDHAAAVGGLIANTPGGISFGLGIFGKISIGDNETLSVIVKTAASRLALRATFAASYLVLKDVHFNVPAP